MNKINNENQVKEILKDVIGNTDKKERDKLYNDYVEKVTPKHNCLFNSINAFWVGGIICVIGQLFITMFTKMEVSKEMSMTYSTIALILLSVILTGFNLYGKIAKLGGAGTLVPITGFANSVAAPAIEYKKEGQVFGIGCKIFTIAGPVILYGIFTSSLIGFIYWVILRMGII